jgi:hypothetical protein
MKAAKTWCVAGLVVVAAFSSASCGKDEANGDGKGGSGVVLPSGGSAGAAGMGRGGTTPTAGSGGTAATAATKLGRGCLDDADCADTDAPGLKCITETDTSLGDDAPPKGLCTMECTSDAECEDIGIAGSLCMTFETGATSGYCVEGCKFGEELGDPPHCHDRPEFACNPAFSDTEEPCTTDADCQGGELCLGSTCAIVFPVCMPACRGDIDCADGLYCDQSFLGGTCVAEKPTGKAFGEPCTIGDEPDECLGFCQADDPADDTNMNGHCALTCGLFRECGWNTATEKFDGACFYGTLLTPEAPASPGAGEFGFCTPSCNCTDECQDPALACSISQQGELPTELFRGPGMCFGKTAATEEYNQCTGSGGDGAGGDGAGGSGSEPVGGAPSGEGGAGGGG